jgi:hypothetical protein
MMGATQHDHVLDRGLTTVLPLDHVVDLAPTRWSITSWMGAAAVAGGDGAPDPAVGAADVEGFAVLTEYYRDEVGVAGDPAQLGRGEAPAGVQQRAADAVLQVFELDGDDPGPGVEPGGDGGERFGVLELTADPPGAVGVGAEVQQSRPGRSSGSGPS